jgi:serine/threonine-protein kinase
MGAVYLAQAEGHAGFGKFFAVKVLHPHLSDDPKVVSLFYREAEIASQIAHPHVCSIVDFGCEDDGLLYLVMEYLSGETLATVLTTCHEAGELPPLWLGPRVVADAARGLHAAHELRTPDGDPLGIVHRDVSPQNVYVLYDGPSKLLDFGVARGHGRLATTTQGVVRGKLAYMSPEQARGDPIDRRTDVWALGAVLWESLTGQRVFRAETDAETLVKLMRDPINPPSAARPQVPPQLDEIVMASLERDPDLRGATAAQIADALEDWIHGSGQRAGHAQVSEWMHARFVREMTAENKTLERATEAAMTHVRAATARQVDRQTTRDLALHQSPTALLQPLRRRSWWTLVGIAALALLVGGAAGLWAALAEPEPSPRSRFAPKPPAPEPAPDPVPAPTPVPVVEEPPPTESEVLDAGAPTPPTKARPGFGQLNLIAFPEATVLLRGQALGETPLRRRLPVGVHTLVLRTADGRRQRITVRIRRGRQTREVVRF